MSKKSHVVGWENSPTPAQLIHFFQIFEDKWITEKNLLILAAMKALRHKILMKIFRFFLIYQSSW